jgi:pyrimidine-specific ribonucleoside hydrolase
MLTLGQAKGVVMRGVLAWVSRAAAIVVAGAMLPAVAGCDGSAATARSATPVIVDTDMASDDIMALCYLLERPGISVRAITVEGTGEAHGLAGARNALRLMRTLGIRRQIPVAYGPPDPVSGFRSFPPAWRAAADQMYNLRVPPWTGPQPSDSAVRLLADTIRRSARPVELITLGPLTNVALALQSDPGIARKIAMIYAMAGAIRVDGNEPIHQRAEWNVYIDAVAASRVLRSGVPMTFVPLDASDSVPVTSMFRDVARAHARTAALGVLATMLSDPYYVRTTVYFWDPLAAVAATDRQVARVVAARLVISTGDGPGMGVTRTSPAGSPARLAVSASAAVFARQFLGTLGGGQTITFPRFPASRTLTVTYDGSSCRYLGPRSVTAGQFQVKLANRSQVPFDGFELALGKLASGRTLSDVQEVIREGTATSVPGWFRVTAMLPGPTGAQPTWTTSLTEDRYALVCVLQRSGGLVALAELTVR